MCSYACVFVRLGLSAELGLDTCFGGRVKVDEALFQLWRDLKYCICCAYMCECVCKMREVHYHICQINNYSSLK